MDVRKVQVGDTIAMLQKILSDLYGRTNYWRLIEGTVKSITLNSKGRRVKADKFYTLSADDVEFATAWMMENELLVLIHEPFILTDELRPRIEAWIAAKNEEKHEEDAQ